MMIMLIKWVNASPVAVLEALAALIAGLLLKSLSRTSRSSPPPSIPSQMSRVEALPAGNAAPQLLNDSASLRRKNSYIRGGLFGRFFFSFLSIIGQFHN